MFKKTIGVIGCGAWGTTLGKVRAENGHDVSIWCHQKAIADEINNTHRNNTLLKDVQLPENISATHQLSDICRVSDAFIFAIASPYLEVVKEFDEPALKEKPILSVTKAFLSKEKGSDEGKIAALIRIQEKLEKKVKNN